MRPIIFALFIACGVVVAQPSFAVEKFEWQPWFNYGFQSRLTQDSTQNINAYESSPWSIGFGHKNFIWYFEHFRQSEQTGNSMLEVSTVTETSLLGFHSYNDDWGFTEYFIPYFGVGLGASRDVVDSRVGDETVRDRSKWYAISDVHMGLYWNYTRFLWVSLEGKVQFGQNLEPNPQFGVLARLGFWFR